MKRVFAQVDRDLIKQVCTLASVLAAFGINVRSNFVPIGGATIGEISNTLFKDVLITPANYAFAIWGVIYLSLFSFGCYQMQAKYRTHRILRRSRSGVIVASLAQIVWVWLFQMRFFVGSFGAMLVILLALIYSYPQVQPNERSRLQADRFWVAFPLSIYLGWISIATISNAAIALTALGWQGWGIAPTVWTIIVILLATGLGGIVYAKQQDVVFIAVVLWAFVAIAIRQNNVPGIAGTAAIGTISLLGWMAWSRYRHGVTSKQNIGQQE